jgi:hypothetical protein
VQLTTSRSIALSLRETRSLLSSRKFALIEALRSKEIRGAPQFEPIQCTFRRLSQSADLINLSDLPQQGPWSRLLYSSSREYWSIHRARRRAADKFSMSSTVRRK